LAVPEPAERFGNVIVQSAKDLAIDNGPQWAAALAYYAALSSIPLVLLAASIASLFVDPQWAVNQLTGALSDFVPQEDSVRDVVTSALQARGQIGLLAFLGFLITGSRAVSTLARALSIAFDSDESQRFWERLVRDSLLLLTVGVYFALAVVAAFLMHPLWQALDGLPARPNVIIGVIQALTQGALLVSAFFLIYRFVPRRNRDSRAALIGALVATLLILIVSPLFQLYVSRARTYNVLYGSLAIAVILLVWIWLLALITLYGGSLAAHIKAIGMDRQSPERVQRAHERRAPTNPKG